jgi:hypothetical protein
MSSEPVSEPKWKSCVLTAGAHDVLPVLIHVFRLIVCVGGGEESVDEERYSGHRTIRRTLKEASRIAPKRTMHWELWVVEAGQGAFHG